MKNITLLIALIVATTVIAQDYRFGKVEEVDFKRITPENEEEPPAEVLYREEYISFRFVQGEGFKQQREVFERIKINTEEGLKYATKQMRLYNESASKRERLKKLKGYTYTLQDGKVKEEKLRSSGEFEEDINEYWKRSSFTMPDVRVGSIIEYEYYIESPFMAIDDVILQYDIPIRKIDLRIELVEYFTYNVLFNPRAAYVPDLTRTMASDKITTTSKERSGAGARMSSTSFSSQQYELKNQILTINDTNIPALIGEPISGDISNYRAKIIFELAAVHYPSEAVKYLSTSWEAVTKTIFDHKMFGGQLEKRPFYSDELDAQLDGVISPRERANRIFQFVKNKVKWNGYLGITASKGTSDAYKEGAGNVADVNLLLTSMLRSQNIDAIPVLISTKDNGVPLFPTRDGFNYVAVLANIENKEILLDATDVNLPMGDLPPRAMNWQGRGVKKDGSSFWVNVMPVTVSKEMVMSNVTLNDDLSITGKANKRLTDQLAYKLRDNFSTRVEEELVKYFQDNKPGFTISNLEVKNMKEVDQPVGFSYDVKLDAAAEKIGDKIYVSPLLNESNDENPFKLEKRNLPVVLGYPISTKTIVNLTLPDGYMVESLPENVQYNYNQGKGYYRFVSSQVGNKITIAADFEMKDFQVLPTDYPMWKEFFTAIVSKDAEKIVLKKI